MYSYLTVWEVVPLSGRGGRGVGWVYRDGVLASVRRGVGGIIYFGGVPPSVWGNRGSSLERAWRDGGATHYLQPATLKTFINRGKSETFAGTHTRGSIFPFFPLEVFLQVWAGMGGHI